MGLLKANHRRLIMSRRTNAGQIVGFIAVLAVAGAMLAAAPAQTKATAPKPQDKLAMGEEQAKQLLLLIDTDKSGKISKQEWMRFMEAEFDRLDKAKNGELDVRELTQSQLRVSHFISVGK
jgi:EF hand